MPMLHAPKLQPIEPEYGEVVAFPRASASEPRDFGRRGERKRLSLVVDLSAEEVGLRWMRGAATLAMLCGSALLLVPGIDPAVVPQPAAAVTIRNAQLSELALPSVATEPPPEAQPSAKGVSMGEKDGLKRISGDVSEGLYWSLRAAGASPDTASDYLKAIATRIDVGEVMPFDRFEFVVSESSGALLYAGLDRAQGSDVELLKWNVGGQQGWFEAGTAPSASAGLMAPVAGRITSGFGARFHPILRYSRFHAGLDFGARWGSPIVAAADGQVIGAGWSGGYGRQVRIAHGDRMMTTYSHMSSIVAAPGMPVRQGQVIGYVGSSGLSTGPHLHFEVRVNGRPVNPLTARLVSRPALDGQQLGAFKARVKQLLSIPIKPVAERTTSSDAVTVG